MALGALALVSCGPSNFAGTYNASLTNHDNGCNLSNWTTGGTVQGLQFVVTQSGSSLTGNVTGLSGLFLDAWIGTSVFAGNTVLNTMHLTAVGTKSQSQGACSYQYTATVDATLNGDAISGTVTYGTTTNNSSDCGSLKGCKSTQAMTGVRPPQ